MTKRIKRHQQNLLPFLTAYYFFLFIQIISADSNEQRRELKCSQPIVPNIQDPAMKDFTYNFGADGEKDQTMKVYVEPNVTSFYKLSKPPASTKVEPKHRGFSGYFINMSNQHLAFYWEPRVGQNASLMSYYEPFAVSGTATFPGHSFFFTPKDDPTNVLYRFQVTVYPNNIYRYDPYYVEGDPEKTRQNLKANLKSPEEFRLYDILDKSRTFNELYKSFTGRSYLVNYPRPPPIHFMWPADYLGQQHWVESWETHFDALPPEVMLSPIVGTGKERKLEPHKRRLLHKYRADGTAPTAQPLNMTLTVLSCAPRIFEIKNFLSQHEVDHVMDLAGASSLSRSQTGSGSLEEDGTRDTRTSRNTWIERERSPIVDAIYRRAADLLRIDEALLRARDPDEAPHIKDLRTMAESLQLVHYDIGQEYTAHHDFGFSNPDDVTQGQRFATVLLYLNEGMVGGSTSFPRWVNAESFDPLRVKPEVGKAVLFYSQLPDGNMDDFSHHQADKLWGGEKWLTNLWVWDPEYSNSPF